MYDRILASSSFELWPSIVAQLVKNPAAMRETWVQSVFWPGEFHGLYSPWDCKESDMIEWLSLSFFNSSSIIAYLEFQFYSWIGLYPYLSDKRKAL